MIQVKTSTKLMKDMKMMNLSRSSLFYKKMKNNCNDYWENKQLYGVSISESVVEINCYNLGKHIVQCEGVINKDIFTTKGWVIYWS